MSGARPDDTARDRAAQAARESYGRLVALLAWQWRDLAAAEDALGDAFAAALQHWPRDGVPASPEAWLMTAAKRRLLERARHARVEQDPAVTALFDTEDSVPEAPVIPDARLKLLYVCAHPALPEAVHAPLMLQAVLGLDAKAIADAFLVSPSAMAQRLVRAKAKIRDAGLRFDEPEARELPERLGAVLEGIYGAYTIGKRHAPIDGHADGLAEEAIYLCRIVVALQPDEPEPLGLLALMLHCEARRPAQFDADGRFVPLAAQEPTHWRRESIVEAEQHLQRASRMGRPGLFQLEAAIQSAHAQRLFTGQTPWPAIGKLYDLLVARHPSVGACVGQAVALAEAGDAAAGLAVLDALEADRVRTYAPYWVARAHLLRKQSGSEAAREALDRAIGLTTDERVRRFLAAQR